MTTLAQVVDRTRRHLMTSQNDIRNELDGAIDNATQTVTLAHPTVGINVGAEMAIDFEEMAVVAVSGQTLTVMRGIGGSTAVSHADGAQVYVKPKFSDYAIFLAVNEALDDLSPDLWRIRQVEITTDPVREGYDLATTDLIDIWRVHADRIGPERDWPALPRSAWRLNLDASMTDFASGKSLTLYIEIDSGRKVRVSYKSSFSSMAANPNDDIATVTGLHREAHRLLPLGAAINLLAGREVKRSFMSPQPEPRRAEEVPAGAAAQAMRPLLALYEDWMQHERIRLARRFPEQIY